MAYFAPSHPCIHSLFTAGDLARCRSREEWGREQEGRQTEPERVNRQQLLKGKVFQKQGVHWHSLLLLLLSLNSWRKCLIKIFVLLCLSEMTYDSSLSQTQNSHSICHSHPIRDSRSPWKIGRPRGGRRETEAADIRPQTMLASQALAGRVNREVLLGGEAGDARAYCRGDASCPSLARAADPEKWPEPPLSHTIL